MDEKLHPKKIAASAYPPDGAPFAQIANLADAYAALLGEPNLAPMAAPHLAAWGVALGVISKRQAAEAIKQALEMGNSAEARLVELARLLAPHLADCGNLQILAVNLKTTLPPPPSVDEETWKLASRIAHALVAGGTVAGGTVAGGTGDDDEALPEITAATVRCALAVRSDRLEMADAWALVAEARRLNPERPERAFHSLVYWIERLRLLAEARPALAGAYAAAIARAPKCPAPSAN